MESGHFQPVWGWLAEYMKTRCKEVVIVNALGLHARAAAEIAKIARGAQAGVWLVKDGVKADATGIIDMLTLACSKGTQIRIVVDDDVDLPTLEAIVAMVEQGFGEKSDNEGV